MITTLVGVLDSKSLEFYYGRKSPSDVSFSVGHSVPRPWPKRALLDTISTFHGSTELFLSDHYDIQSADTIEGKCIVHSFKSYMKLDAVGTDDFFCRFEYSSSTGAFTPDRVAVYCNCEMPYNPVDLMVQCEGCSNCWFTWQLLVEEMPFLEGNESIERTFKGVARNFREVFSELVQGGHGFLVMMKKKDGDHGDDDQDEDGPREPDKEGRVEKYIGVKVKVSFTGQGETQSMKQLSGDAALDPQYRTAVGNMIRRLADQANTQFITTTFRPELVKVADKIYGVTHKNRVSRVNVVSKDEALDFIEHDQSHNAD
ncbi:hypothetical protein Nepgr_003017 [Nepenthes gracilis]|uniref:BAH domain-containing protein n=1 Tax=Nepenthes gracilis TaxID=150966 RepID=A0AAD3RYR6_NEPGR|nr:hypothetical protein Nepgr_003017 [Nepenthes gracilis]